MPEPVPPRLTHRMLFVGFFQAGILGFGGVLPIARRMIVDERKWLTQTQFNDLFALCQFLPGANIVNLAFIFGARHGGLTGAAAAVAGLLTAPIIIVMILSAAYADWGAEPLARHALAGLAAGAAGLVAGTALRISGPIFRRPESIALAVSVVGLVVFGHFSLFRTILVVLPASLWVAWRGA